MEPLEPITTLYWSAKTHHQCATISTTNPPQTHSIFTHKQNKYPLDPSRHADPRERPITILHTDQCPRHARPPPDHHTHDHHDPPSKLSSKPTAKTD